MRHRQDLATGAALYCGDCVEVLSGLAEASVDAVVTDPPYGIRFMGKAWDGADIDARWKADERSHAGRTVRPPAGRTAKPGLICSPSVAAGSYDLTPKGMAAFQSFTLDWCREALRILKPGGHLVSFSSTRTYHRMACGIEDAGFEIRDSLAWLYGTGFPKSHNLHGQWEGWGTALKPAHEPICLARKPLSEGTVAANVLRWGTGALNIDATRVETNESTQRPTGTVSLGASGGWANPNTRNVLGGSTSGRWPANVCHDGSDEVVDLFPDAGGGYGTGNRKEGTGIYGAFSGATKGKTVGFGDSGSAARFFYSAKADRHDRTGSKHPTVKPVDLMRWLVRMVTPPGGTVLDPFAGSGTTGEAALMEGMRAILIERETAYQADSRARFSERMSAALAQPDLFIERPKPFLEHPR